MGWFWSLDLLFFFCRICRIILTFSFAFFVWLCTSTTYWLELPRNSIPEGSHYKVLTTEYGPTEKQEGYEASIYPSKKQRIRPVTLWPSNISWRTRHGPSTELYFRLQNRQKSMWRLEISWFPQRSCCSFWCSLQTGSSVPSIGTLSLVTGIGFLDSLGSDFRTTPIFFFLYGVQSCIRDLYPEFHVHILSCRVYRMVIGIAQWSRYC